MHHCRCSPASLNQFWSSASACGVSMVKGYKRPAAKVGETIAALSFSPTNDGSDLSIMARVTIESSVQKYLYLHRFSGLKSTATTPDNVLYSGFDTWNTRRMQARMVAARAVLLAAKIRRVSRVGEKDSW